MNRAARIVLAVVVVALLAGDAAAYRHVKQSPYPSHWDDRVVRLASFVEQARHLRFKHPVKVEFLSVDAYKRRNQRSQRDLSATQKRDLKIFEGQAHALGLLSRDADLLKELNTLNSDATAAYYDDHAKEMVIRGTTLTVDLRVTLVHELTHALQDQSFGINRSFTTDGASSFFDALVEGDAVRIQNEYVTSLSSSDQSAYFAEQQANSSQATGAVASVPPALLSLFAAPYDLGEPLTRLIITEHGNAGLDKLFVHPADSDEGLLNAFAAIDNQRAKKVKTPALQPGEKKTDSGDFGAVAWYVMLSSFTDPHTALTAVDGWGGDAYVGYVKDAKPCIRIAFEGDTPNDNVEMAGALTQFKAAFTENSLQVAAMADRVELDACEPNVVPKPRPDAARALELPATRLQILDVLLSSHVGRTVADCITRHLLAAIPLDKINSDNAADQRNLGAVTQQISRSCAAGQIV